MLKSERASYSPSPGADPRSLHLNANQRRLVGLAQRLVFGSIHNLRVSTGSPSFDPPPRVVRVHKHGGSNRPRPQSAVEDFALKHEWIEFFNELEAISDGEILLIEIAHGLPHLFKIEEAVV